MTEFKQVVNNWKGGGRGGFSVHSQGIGITFLAQE